MMLGARTDLENLPSDLSRARILVVEDDRELRDLLAQLFTQAGYAVDAVADGQAGLHRALTDPYDVLVIDRGLPAVEGLDLVRRLRRRGVATPVLILTAYGSVSDVVSGLDAGAEDYLVKPFEIDVLLARVRALLRRHASTEALIQVGGAVLDMMARVARLSNGETVELSGRETALLRILAGSPNRVFSREDLKTKVFGSAESASIVDTYVHYLRRKLGNGAVRTVRGYGYKIGTL